MKGNKKKLSIDEKFVNAERILAGKEPNPNGRLLFERTIKKAANPKPSQIKAFLNCSETVDRPIKSSIPLFLQDIQVCLD